MHACKEGTCHVSQAVYTDEPINNGRLSQIMLNIAPWTNCHGNSF
jgi:hypothetical protein